MQVCSLDHLVLTVRSIPASCDFYARVLGLRVVRFGAGRTALTFGRQKINLHEAGKELDPKAARPTPGSGDLCFLTKVALARVIEHIRACGVEILEGPVRRPGAVAALESIYLRDPDGNLIEVSNEVPAQPRETDQVAHSDPLRLVAAQDRLSGGPGVGFAGDAVTGEPPAIRDAAAADAAALAAIYNQGIADRVATLEIEERTAEERASWIAARTVRHPVLVAVVGDRLVGWGSLNPFNPRKAYEPVADFSLYIERSWRGRGVGGLLLAALTERARQLGYHKMVLSAFPWNAAGMALYQKHGFRTVGIYKEQGLLDGQWVDTLIMEKIL